MENLNLYNYFRSSTSYRARIALELKQLKYTYTPVHLINNGGEQNSSDYRKLNPMGGVPTLIHDGKTLSQSFAIVEYLDEVFPDHVSFFPKDSFMKAKIKQACEIINADIHPLQNLKVTNFLEKDLKISAEQKNQWLTKWITEGLTAFENTIAPYAKQYCFGDQVTAADIFLIPQLFTATRFNVDFSQFTILSKINENCLAQQAFKKAHPYRQSDTPKDLLIS
ncbi:maleylacetoacetate isomerase [bacterium]|nr:maleylacetoacetate isomerase [bacterium]